ncbi:unnamed protein product [Rangifer tarandus platyrhynchus]|uniref:Uncharacterized protein n=1 Tax=Rangifer tarandus platyrhynchus TaxID=3082113 RepID=A0AC59ZNE1_RANTA
MIESFRKLSLVSVILICRGGRIWYILITTNEGGLKLASRAKRLCTDLVVTRITELAPPRSLRLSVLVESSAFLTGSLVMQPVLLIWEPHFENQCPYLSRQWTGSVVSIILVLPPMVVESWESYGWSENTLAQSILTAALS